MTHVIVIGAGQEGFSLVAKLRKCGFDGQITLISFWYYKGDELVAVDVMNAPRDCMIARRLIESGKSPAPEAVADPATDIKALLTMRESFRTAFAGAQRCRGASATKAFFRAHFSAASMAAEGEDFLPIQARDGSMTLNPIGSARSGCVTYISPLSSR